MRASAERISPDDESRDLMFAEFDLGRFINSSLQLNWPAISKLVIIYHPIGRISRAKIIAELRNGMRKTEVSGCSTGRQKMQIKCAGIVGMNEGNGSELGGFFFDALCQLMGESL